MGNDSPKRSLPADFPEGSPDFDVGGDRVAPEGGDIEASNIKKAEQEPEVIDWDALNESDIDDPASSNTHLPLSDVPDTRESVGRGTVDSNGGLQQTAEASKAEHVPRPPVAVAEEKEAPKLEPEADLPVENVVRDSSIEPSAQYTGVNADKSGVPEESTGKVDSPDNLVAAEPAEFDHAGTEDAEEGDVKKKAGDAKEGDVKEGVDDAKEVDLDKEADDAKNADDARAIDVNKGEVFEEFEPSVLGRDFAGELASGSEDYESASEVGERPPAEDVLGGEEVEANPREFENEGKVDRTDENPEHSSAIPENSSLSNKEDVESEAQGALDVSQGLEAGKEPSATQIPHAENNEEVEPQVVSVSSKGQESERESPAVEAAGDVSVEGESSVPENDSSVPGVEDRKKEESIESPISEKTVDDSSQDEELADEKPPSVAATEDSSKDSSAAQAPGPEDNETEEAQFLGGLSKGEESEQGPPANEAAGDPTVAGEDPSFENTSLVPADEESKKEEGVDSPSLEKTTNVSSKEKEVEGIGSRSVEKTADVSPKSNASVDEKPSSVAASGDSSKASTTPGNDASSSLGAGGPSLPARPAGLGRSVPSLEHAPRAVQRSSAVPASVRQASATDDENGSITDVSEGSEDAREKLQMIRVKFLRLANRLGQSAHNVVVAQVLYRLGLAEQLRGGRGTGRTGAFSFERASSLADEQEAAGIGDLEFGCTIMVLGKSGVGKSATINSLFDEVKSGTNAYSPATSKVQEIIGTVHGIKLRVIDTPGLLTSFADQRRNERIMSSVKRFIKKSPPDIVLYFDRLDMQSRDYGDLPLLRTITDTFGSAVWFNAIVVLTHASSAPPDGANGVPVSYEMFVAQRSHVVQQTIRQAAGDMRLMNPVSLVENHAACRRNRAGERVLPNGQVWKPQLLLLCFASKILAEANSLLKLQDNSPAKPFGVRSRVPPLPFLLSSLLQSRAQLKLPDEQLGSDDESEDESDEEADSDGEEDYDDLPPFRRLAKDELKLLDKEQRKIYAEELEYREKLFMKKQLKDERARKKELKRRMAALPKEAAQFAEEMLEDGNASASVPVPMPDMALPPSFDSDNPTYRYRYLDNANQWLVRPVLETHGWDHDSGYDGLNVEKMFVVSKKVPVSLSGQVTKDKKEANLQMECAASFKNGEGKYTQAGLDIQTIGKDLAYTVRSETRFDNFKRNKTTCGLAVTLLGDTVAAGMKIEDRLLIGKRAKLVFNGGALTGRGDVAYGGSLEATIKDKDYPIGQFLSTFGLSVMDWHGDLAVGGNLQVQCKLGKTTTIVRGNLNNRKAGQISIRISNSEQLQIALIGLIPLLRTFINNRILSSN